MFYSDDSDFMSNLKKQMEDDFAYDVMMDTNFSGAFPENGEADYPNNDSFIFDDDEDDFSFDDEDDEDDYDGDGFLSKDYCNGNSENDVATYSVSLTFQFDPCIQEKTNEPKDEGLEEEHYSQERFISDIKNQFPILSENFTDEELSDPAGALFVICNNNMKEALNCWKAIIEKNENLLLKEPELEFFKRNLIEYFPFTVLSDYCNENSSPMFDFILSDRYINRLLFSTIPYDPDNSAQFLYLNQCFYYNKISDFKAAYFKLLNNKNYIKKPDKYYIILEALELSCLGRTAISYEFYNFLSNEIAIIKPSKKTDYLLDKLRKAWRDDISYSGIRYENNSSDLNSIELYNDPCKYAKNSTINEEIILTKLLHKKDELLCDVEYCEEELKNAKNSLDDIEKKIKDFQQYIKSQTPSQKSANFREKQDVFLNYAHIVGMEYCDQSAVGNLSVGEHLLLVHENNNEYDKNAVAVFTSDYKKVGYISRNENCILSQDIDSGAEIYAKTTAKPSSASCKYMKVELWGKSKK